MIPHESPGHHCLSPMNGAATRALRNNRHRRPRCRRSHGAPERHGREGESPRRCVEPLHDDVEAAAQARRGRRAPARHPAPAMGERSGRNPARLRRLCLLFARIVARGRRCGEIDTEGCQRTDASTHLFSCDRQLDVAARRGPIGLGDGVAHLTAEHHHRRRRRNPQAHPLASDLGHDDFDVVAYRNSVSLAARDDQHSASSEARLVPPRQPHRYRAEHCHGSDIRTD